MKQTLSKDTFRFLFNQIRPDNFNYEGQGIIFDYLEQYEDDTGEQIEFDPIAICCDYSQASPREIIDAFGLDIALDGNESLAVQDYLNDHTIILGVCEHGEIVFQNF